ncbi:DUF7674 family protein [Thalassospira tepidiphila]|jgi:hypothetical protein|uniref:DUF7674 family protein n=1 Tax=Thalassospira tepidiphila TaxID=393657 RepID=UPI0029220616|nr:hypothetical protein MACH01_21680 [Thalassospira tepidiphila]
MSAICVAFSAGAAFKFRELESTLAEHLKDNNGEILPHLLMADYFRCVESAVDAEWVRGFLSYLEENFSYKNREIINLISVSFLEHLSPEDSSTRFLGELLGPEMLKEYQCIFGKRQT